MTPYLWPRNVLSQLLNFVSFFSLAHTLTPKEGSATRPLAITRLLLSVAVNRMQTVVSSTKAAW